MWVKYLLLFLKVILVNETWRCQSVEIDDNLTFCKNHKCWDVWQKKKIEFWTYLSLNSKSACFEFGVDFTPSKYFIWRIYLRHVWGQTLLSLEVIFSSLDFGYRITSWNLVKTRVRNWLIGNTVYFKHLKEIF